jgi:2-oxoglutarate dehydrogenase E1 component
MSTIPFSSDNFDLLDAQYERWRRDPRALGPEWSNFFSGFELGYTHQENARHDLPEGVDSTDELVGRLTRVDGLVYAYRTLGHTRALLDPLSRSRPEQPLLALKEFGFLEADLDKPVSSKFFMGGRTLSLGELIASLEAIYCGPIGAEFVHIQNPRTRNWVRDRIESRLSAPPPETAELRRMLRVLIEAEEFEHYLHTRHVGQKRFSLEGSESLMVLLDTLLEHCPQTGVQEIVMGMAHRGRLNVLANFLHKSLRVLFTEFSENYIPDLVGGDGDVKYHLGYEVRRTTATGEPVEIRLAANPSHLEAVNPVVQGKARARQRILNDSQERRKVLPLLLHGDAAFAGQGMVAEVLNLSQLQGYRTGGTVHIVVNNQIGFTTLPADARSTQYATDVAKMIEAPIFHVNGDDPAAVAFVARMAFDYRQQFRGDVVIDLYGYRRHGHNEGDEPLFTQPDMYAQIQKHPSVSRIFRDKLIADRQITAAQADALESEYLARLETAHREVEAPAESRAPENPRFLESNAVFQPAYTHDPADTAIAHETLRTVVRGLTTVPADFKVLPKIRKLLLEKRERIFREGGPYDWAYGESLAFGSLLLEGVPVRLSGQDSRRGTFSQRHSVLYEEETRDRYIPLLNLAPDQARFCVYNSMLSEAAVLGFDYGYSLDYPSMLCIWEAQFGDFANGAQVIIDQFIVPSESKWQRPSGIVMLLPHGYEGQGPEHSSARLERFLQLCAEDNIQVCNPTTPAQYFHLLRRQVKRPFRKPLVVMTPKSLLRSEAAVSHEKDFTTGAFREILQDPGAPDPAAVRRVILCSGKVYYDLAKFRAAQGIGDAALLRVEQLYPLHENLMRERLAEFAGATSVVWCQEESQNMGAWSFLEPRLRRLLGREILYAGRDASASPAVGSLALHRREQEKLIREAFGQPPA